MDFEIELSGDKIKLFSIATDFETYKKLLPDQIRDIKIIQQSESETITEETLLFASVVKKEINQQSKHQIKGNVIDSEIISGPLKGSKVHAQFTELSNGTKISISFELKITLMYKILTPLIKKYYKIILRALFYKMNNMVTSN